MKPSKGSWINELNYILLPMFITSINIGGSLILHYKINCINFFRNYTIYIIVSSTSRALIPRLVINSDAFLDKIYSFCMVYNILR